MDIPTEARLSTGEPFTVNALLAARHGDLLDIPADLLAAIATADTLAREADTLGRAHSALKAIDPTDLGIRSVVSAVESGGDIAEAALAGAQHERATADAFARYGIVDKAARTHGRRVHTLVRDHAEAIGVELLDSLTDLLHDAAPAASDMAGFDYADPAALLGADKPVQAAFAALRPLAERHDLIRKTAAALAAGAPDWDGVSAFEGHGLERWAPFSMGPQSTRWRFAPSGHPVQRLVAAATEAAAALTPVA